MTDFKLEAHKKEEKPKALRRNGLIPAIIYGKKFDSVAIAVNAIEFNKVFKEAGMSNLIEIKLEDSKVKTIIGDFQTDPKTDLITHIDFIKVNMKEKIHAEIPIEFIGDSRAVIDLEGSLITPVDTLEVECLPGDLISELKVDISILDDFEKNIKISDLQLPEGIEVQNDPEEIVAFVQEPRSDEEMEQLDEEVVEDVESIEVENKGEEAPAEGEEENKEGKEDK